MPRPASPSKLQIMYGLRGERRLTELTLPWLRGYESSEPVRIGNAAHTQVQLDVYGELMDTMHVARKFKLEPYDEAWQLQKALVRFVAQSWHRPDHGIWEVRGPAQHFTYSKVMAWVTLDRAVKSVENFGLEGPVDEWRRLRTEIHADICDKGYSRRKGCFTQVYGSEPVDASLLLLGQLGFVRCDDARYIATIEAVERELLVGASCSATGRSTSRMASRRAKARSLPAVSGSSMPTCWSGATTTPCACSNACWNSAMISGCWPRSTTPPPDGSWGISRRRSRTSR